MAIPAPTAGIPQRSRAEIDLPVTTSTGMSLISSNLAVVEFSNRRLRVFFLAEPMMMRLQPKRIASLFKASPLSPVTWVKEKLTPDFSRYSAADLAVSFARSACQELTSPLLKNLLI